MIKKTKRVSLKNPVFIACWPGMGEVAIRTGMFLKEALDFQPFAEIRNSGFFAPQGIISQDGVAEFPHIDEGTFYVYKDPNKKQDIVLFLSEAQPPMDKAHAFATMLADFIVSIKAKLVFTFASLPQPIEYTKDSSVWAVVSDEQLLDEVKNYSINVLPEGHISGLNGLLVGVVKELGIHGLCLLAEIPFYTVQIENPKATKAILDVMAKYFSLELDLDQLNSKAQSLESEISRLISYIKGEDVEEGEDIEEAPLSEDDIMKIRSELARFPQLPKSVSTKIEELFTKSKEDIYHAQELKKILDHWGVYKDYEDRFLDLFKNQGLDH